MNQDCITASHVIDVSRFPYKDPDPIVRHAGIRPSVSALMI